MKTEHTFWKIYMFWRHLFGMCFTGRCRNASACIMWDAMFCRFVYLALMGEKRLNVYARRANNKLKLKQVTYP